MQDMGQEATEILAERVTFDLTGILALLGSERARAFVDGVIKRLKERFGTQKVAGSTMHQQSRSPGERLHRGYKTVTGQVMSVSGGLTMAC